MGKEILELWEDISLVLVGSYGLGQVHFSF